MLNESLRGHRRTEPQRLLPGLAQVEEPSVRGGAARGGGGLGSMIEGKNRIMIFGPKDDGTYVVEFRTAQGEALAISIPRSETAVIRYFQERMPVRAVRP
jgi:hypothetical protein